MNKNEDIAWVTRCALFDDRRAFACLVDKYQVRLKRFFLNLTGGDPVLSDDLAQETFIKVYYNLRSYKGLSSFSTWIYRVAYNVFYDELRKSREWEDASVAKIAEIMSISEGTVKSHLFRAKQKLGEYLKKNGYE